jgi:hypothetical protein
MLPWHWLPPHRGADVRVESEMLQQGVMTEDLDEIVVRRLDLALLVLVERVEEILERHRGLVGRI